MPIRDLRDTLENRIDQDIFEAEREFAETS